MKYKIYLFLLFLPYIASSTTTSLPCVCRSFALPELVQKVKSAAATIYVFNSRGEVVNQGSGFFITENVVISSRHVFWKEAASHGKVVVVSPRAKNTTEYPIKHIIGDNENSDLVMLAVENPPTGTLQPHVNISLAEVKEGEDVFVISSPEDLRGSIGTGIVSAIHNDYDMQISVSAISAGSSGAPIFNYDGEVIGVVVGQFQSGQNLNFGISVQGIVDLVKDIEERQKERLLAASKHPSKHPSKTQPLLPPPEKKPPMSRRHHWTFTEQSEVNSEECAVYPTIKEWINTQEEFKQKKKSKTNSLWRSFKRLWSQVTNSSHQEAESS